MALGAYPLATWACRMPGAAPAPALRSDRAASSPTPWLAPQGVPFRSMIAGALSALAFASRRRATARSEKRAVAMRSQVRSADEEGAGGSDAESRSPSCRACGGRRVALGRRHASAVVGAGSVFLWGNGGAQAELIREGSTCINCGGEGINPCFRCNGTAQMTMLSDKTRTVECTECGATGYKLCGKCSATGLPRAELKPLMKDRELRTTLARLTKERLFPEGRKKIKEGVAAALAAARERQAAAA
uniref:Uncharacterized protein n=1 Tax=Alexandrium andersonii TaxID=327968 RepID=A0A7S2GMC2_9DINO|mmetsp:Transcript_58515/g.131614  ORF Transcript_58515/g.131614 Transcript_58515/m.131614 type:complete len:246 (+) Transcript_58515:51-788(+)